MENNKRNNSEAGINELSKLLLELYSLKKSANDKKSQRDYEIYVQDIKRFLKKASRKVLTSEEIQVYIDDYQEVVQKAEENDIDR